MKFVSLLSGGKDSCFSAMLAVEHGHELVCLANLYPGKGYAGDEMNSFMYQSAAHSAIPYLAECIEKPLFRREIKGKSIDQSLTYSNCANTANIDGNLGDDYDEVEDLFLLLVDVKKRFPDIEAVSCGAIISNYQRYRVENVCKRLGLTSITFLWNMDRVELLENMVQKYNVVATLVKVSGVGLQPYKHLNKTLNEMYPLLHTYHNKYGLDVCGEGGEYETLVLDCPLFPHKKVVLDNTDIHVDSNDDSIGILLIDSCHTEWKDGVNTKCEVSPVEIIESQATREEAMSVCVNHVSEMKLTEIISSDMPLPRYEIDLNGLGHTDIIYAPSGGSLEQQAHIVMSQLNRLMLSIHGQNPDHPVDGTNFMTDVCYVHLYLADMNDFSLVNNVYCKYFNGKTGNNCPPSRCCISIPMAVGCSVGVSALFFKKSHTETFAAIGDRKDAALTYNEFNLQQINVRRRRDVLYVSSVSEWAPICIGPYSQCNILSGCLICIAGQIGLEPGSMQIISSSRSPCEPSTISVPSKVSHDLWSKVSSQLQCCIQNYNRILHRVMQLQVDSLSLRNKNTLNCNYVLATVYLNKRALCEHVDCGVVEMNSLVEGVTDLMNWCMGNENGHGVCEGNNNTRFGMNRKFPDSRTQLKSVSVSAFGFDAPDCESEVEEVENGSSKLHIAPQARSPVVIPVAVVLVEDLPMGALVELEMLSVLTNNVHAYETSIVTHRAMHAYNSTNMNPVKSEGEEEGECAVGPADPFEPMYTLLAAESTVEVAGRGSRSAYTRTNVECYQLDVVIHCCVTWIRHAHNYCTGTVESFSEESISLGCTYHHFVAVLQQIYSLLNSTITSHDASDELSKKCVPMSTQALVVIKVYFPSGSEFTDACGLSACSAVFGDKPYKPLVSFVPAVNVFSTENSNKCAQFSATFHCIDTLQMRTEQWIFKEPDF